MHLNLVFFLHLWSVKLSGAKKFMKTQISRSRVCQERRVQHVDLGYYSMNASCLQSTKNSPVNLCYQATECHCSASTLWVKTLILVSDLSFMLLLSLETSRLPARGWYLCHFNSKWFISLSHIDEGIQQCHSNWTTKYTTLPSIPFHWAALID